MHAFAPDNVICCLCGNPVATDPANPGEALSMDHVPPKQFYPREVRNTQNPYLWVVPTHNCCNGEYRQDEEYFYHVVYPLVRKANPSMGQIIHRDLLRRRVRPQTPAMFRSILKNAAPVTDGGIHLTPRMVQLDLDAYRIKRIAIKIAQGIFYLDQERYMPRQTCKEILLCEAEAEVPERYQLVCSEMEARSVLPEVFSYWRIEFDNLNVFSMLFWKAFLFCAAFEDPLAVTAREASRREVQSND